MLRDYQSDCVESVLAEWDKGVRSTLVTIFTSGGKTVIACELIKRMQPLRTMFIAEAVELINQAKDRIKTFTGLDAEIEMAEQYAHSNLFHKSPVVISTIQTQRSGKQGELKRMHRFIPNDFGLLIIDEIHHGLAPSYLRLIEHYSQNPNLKIVGLTATPNRHDGKALAQICQSVAFNYPIHDPLNNRGGIKDGWLVDVCQHFYPVIGLDYSHIHTTAGDLNSGELAAVMEEEDIVQKTCQPTLEVMFALEPHALDKVAVEQWGAFLLGLNRKPRRTIMFTASVLQADLSCRVFNRAIPKLAEFLSGKTDKEVVRPELTRRFARGETSIVCTCGCWQEGFDDAGVELIVMAKPTKSLVRYTQMLGRGTRILPGTVDELVTAQERVAAIAASNKPRCRVLDFVGNSGRHRIMTSMDVLGGKMSEDTIKEAIQKAVSDGKPKSVLKTLSNAEVEVERKKREAARKWNEAQEQRRKHLLARVRFEAHEVDPFGRADGQPHLPKLRCNGKQLSEKQLRILKSRRWPTDKLTYGQARHIIGIMADHNWMMTPELIKWRDGLLKKEQVSV